MSGRDRRFRKNRPWPTAEQTNARIARVLGLIVTAQFFLAGLNNVFDGVGMLVLWVAIGIVVGTATMQMERFLLRRRRI